jgi:1-acyl-sn-glycerol-3-phosphate acyltransferase
MPASPYVPTLDLDVLAQAEADDDGDVAPVGPTEARLVTPSSLGSSEPAPPPVTAPGGSERAPRASSVEDLERQIRELEARLDAMIKKNERPPPPRATPSSPGVPGRAVTAEPERGFIDTARELLSTDFYLRQWGRLGLRGRSEEVDEFGLDPKYESRYLPLFDFLHKVYFRVETQGTHHIPSVGRCLLVANHSGGPLPYDGIMLRTAVRREHADHRQVRWLAEDFIYYLPFIGAVMSRIGAVRACQENAERLLAKGNAVAVFPEGAKGIGKLYKDRYQLQRFGRGGFIRLCLRTQTPLVPCAIIGAEEANPMLYRIEYMTKALGVPYLPITPTFPALGPLGLLPAPTKWRIVFGERMTFDEYGPEAADDEILVGRLSERVRHTIQGMLEDALATRQSIWFG